MSARPLYHCAVVTVRDKSTSSHTSGSVTTTKEGRNISVSNNINTKVVHEVIVEFSDGEQLPLRIEDESFHVPVNQKTLIAFMNGSPVAYQPTKRGSPYTLNYLTTPSHWFDLNGIWGAIAIFCLPVIATIMQFAMLTKDLTSYSDGKMVVFNELKLVAIAGLIVSPIGYFLAKGFIGYVIAAFIGGLATLISFMRHDRLEYLGKKKMLADIAKQFETMQEQLS